MSPSFSRSLPHTLFHTHTHTLHTHTPALWGRLRHAHLLFCHTPTGIFCNTHTLTHTLTHSLTHSNTRTHTLSYTRRRCPSGALQSSVRGSVSVLTRGPDSLCSLFLSASHTPTSLSLFLSLSLFPPFLSHSIPFPRSHAPSLSGSVSVNISCHSPCM